MKTIGLTGGIGSGKTTVGEVFKQIGIPVYNCDLQAKLLTNKNSEIKIKLISLFGKDIYDNKGLDRPKLAEIIFKDKSALEKVNSIIHPIVRQDFSHWVKNQNNVPYVIQESAIMFESGLFQSLDMVITVTAPVEIRKKRVILRDNLSEGQVLSRMNNQISDDERVQKSNFVIVNDDQNLIIPQVLFVDSEIKK